MSSDEVTSKPWLPEFLKQLLAFASVFTALAYWLGRIYAEGYFGVLNIDMSMLQLQWPDFLSFGWVFLSGGGILLGILASWGLTVLIGYYILAPLFSGAFEKHKIAFVRILIPAYILLFAYIFRGEILALWRTLTTPWRIALAVILVILIFLGWLFRKSLRRTILAWADAQRSPEHKERLERLFLLERNIVLVVAA